jgi:hypothetical protein
VRRSAARRAEVLRKFSTDGLSLDEVRSWLVPGLRDF